MNTLLNYKLHQPEKPISSIPIVFVHGLFGDLNNLAMLARGLQEQFITLRIDVRNHGDSFRSNRMNYAEMAQDIIDLLAELNQSKAILIGHSMGGKIAMAVTSIKPELVEKLIVIDIAPVAYQEQRHDQIFTALRAVIDKKVTSRQQAAEVMSEYLTEEGVIQFLLKSFYQGKWKFNLPILLADYAEITGWEDVPPWTGNVLFISGGNSNYIKEIYRNNIVKQFPNSTAWIIAGTGHWVHAEKPNAVLRAIHRFLQLGMNNSSL